MIYGGFYLSEQPIANKTKTTTAATAQPITPPGTLASSLLTTRPRTLNEGESSMDVANFSSIPKEIN
jgi:hypothetical protein